MPDKTQHELKKFEETVAACNRCGFCTSYCPTYNATGSEVHSPRGRNQLFRALIEGKITDEKQVEEAIDTCLLCGECTSVCFSEVPTARLMVEARHFLNQKRGVSPVLSFVLSRLLPHPVQLARILKALFVAKNLGLSWVFSRFGFLKRFAPEIETANKLIPHLPVKFLMDYSSARSRREQTLVEFQMQQPRGSSTLAGQKSRIAYMPVCGSQYIRPSVGLATLKLFERLKIEVIIPEVVCCGLPATSYGVTESLQTLASSNIQALERGRYETVVVDDSSCAAQLKELAPAFSNDPNQAKRAFDLSQKIRDVSTFLVQRGLKDHLRLVPWEGGAVAFHDPCKAQYGLKVTTPPRELLSIIPRIKLMPIASADQCCGGAGTFSVVHPEMSQQILDEKIKNIVASGCKIVVTSSTSCLIQLAFGLRKIQSDIQAYHLTEFLVRAIEKRR